MLALMVTLLYAYCFPFFLARSAGIYVMVLTRLKTLTGKSLCGFKKALMSIHHTARIGYTNKGYLRISSAVLF